MVFVFAFFFVLLNKEVVTQPTVDQSDQSNAYVYRDEMNQCNHKLHGCEKLRKDQHEQCAKVALNDAQSATGASNCFPSKTTAATKVCFNESELIGSTLSKFDDLQSLTEKSKIDALYVTQIVLYLRSWGANTTIIGAIDVHYNTSDMRKHGEECGDQQLARVPITLAPDDRIVEINSRAGDMIDQLTFITKKTTFGPYGGDGGTLRVWKPPTTDGYLAYVKGSTVATYGCVGIRYMQFVWGYRDSN